MLIDVFIDGGKYPISLSFFYKENGLIVESKLIGVTISTFSIHKKYEGATIEDSLAVICQEIKRANEELMNQN